MDREGGREAQEGGDIGIYVCIWLIHLVVRQKVTVSIIVKQLYSNEDVLKKKKKKTDIKF